MKDGLISIHGFIVFAVLVMTMILFRQYNRSSQFEDGFNSLYKSLDNYKYSIPSKPLEQRIAISKDSTLVIRHLVLNEDDLENIREMFQ